MKGRMNRVRAKATDGREVVGQFLLVRSFDGKREMPVVVEDDNRQMTDVLLESVEASTGFRDMRGREIYEGDMICWPRWKGETRNGWRKCKIVWNEMTGSFEAVQEHGWRFTWLPPIYPQCWVMTEEAPTREELDALSEKSKSLRGRFAFIDTKSGLTEK